MRNLRYGLQEKSAHRFNTLVDILSKIARKVSKTRKFKLNQQALKNAILKEHQQTRFSQVPYAAVCTYPLLVVFVIFIHISITFFLNYTFGVFQ